MGARGNTDASRIWKEMHWKEIKRQRPAEPGFFFPVKMLFSENNYFSKGEIKL